MASPMPVAINRLVVLLLAALSALALTELVRDFSRWNTLHVYHAFLALLAASFAATAHSTYRRHHSAPTLLRTCASAFLLYAAIVLLFGTEDVGGLRVSVPLATACLLVSIALFVYASFLHDEFVT